MLYCSRPTGIHFVTIPIGLESFVVTAGRSSVNFANFLVIQAQSH